MGFLHSGDEAQEVTSAVPNVQVDPAVLAQQQNFVNALQAQAAGTGPSVATEMLKQQANANAANAQSMAQGQRGVNAGLAQRNAMNAGAQANAQAAQQGIVARNQEQLNAQGLLGNQLNTLQSQNMGAQQANQNAGLGKASIQTGAAQQDANTNAGIFGGILNSVGKGAAALSDERAKTNIQDGTSETYKFLDNLSAHKYVYKDPQAPGASPGEQLGVMAQDVEKGAPQMVMNTEAGKMLDPAKAVGPQLAALSDLHERLKRLEGVKMAAGGFVDPGMVNYQGLAKPITPYAPMDFGGPSAPTGGGGQISAIQGYGADAQAMAGGPMDAMGGAGGAEGASQLAMMMASKGAVVPGKAMHKGDDVRNDTVKAQLSPGEIVIPRSITQGNNPGKKAMDFVNALLAKSSMKSKAK